MKLKAQQQDDQVHVHFESRAHRKQQEEADQSILYFVARPYYENMPIQIYWKFYQQKMKILR